MRPPNPAGLLVEHPVLPVPAFRGGRCFPAPPDRDSIPVKKLSRHDRMLVAVQLTAAVGLLADFDLWYHGRAFRSLVIARTGDGPRALFRSWPGSLSPVIDALGGGESAVERLRAAALRRIAGAVGLAAAELEGRHGDLGLSLQGAVAHQLERLRERVDPVTGRALWALRWDGIEDAPEGLVRLWRVPIAESASRLGAALWCGLRRQDRRAWIKAGDERWMDDPAAPDLCGPGTLIVVGDLGHNELNAVSRWVEQEGCSAVVLGSVPHGWRAAGPELGSGQLGQHLAVTGLSTDKARVVVEERSGRFDPLQPLDRSAVTQSIRSHLGCGRRGRTRADAAPAPRPVADWLALAPGGLPMGFLALNTGLAPDVLRSECECIGVIETGGRWRLPAPRPLQTDPRHRLVAALYEPGSPDHLLHAALGAGEASDLVSWGRAALGRLEAAEVREQLEKVSRGALGPEAELLYAEACLALLDLWGARAALAGRSQARGSLHRRWLAAVDPAPGQWHEPASRNEAERWPRAAAELGVLLLMAARRRGESARSDAARASLDLCRRWLSDREKRRMDIDATFAEAPHRLADRSWRHRVVGRCAPLRVQAAHRLAVWRLDQGDWETAQRLLRLLSRDPIGPGLRGVYELDLGAAALAAGRSRAGVRHHLRAYHLLQTAGFEQRIRVPLFNLAVADVDQLRIRHGERRLTDLRALDPSDPFVMGERTRLALAVGDEPAFRRRLASFESSVEPNDPRFAEGLALLRGVAALLAGDAGSALAELRRAGEEGTAWQALARGVSGDSVPPTPPDEWGVASAAQLVEERGDLRRSGSMPADWQPDHLRSALAAAVAERVTGERLPLDPDSRSTAVRTLRTAGLSGWADCCEGLGEGFRDLVTALGRVLETGSLATVEELHHAALVTTLGVTGLEIRDGPSEEVLWQWGTGRRGPELRHGRLVVAPMGGALLEGPVRHLVLGVLELVLPVTAAQRDEGGESTRFLGISDGARKLRRELHQLGPSHLPILLLGETGVGKEVAARALHRLSGRTGSFVAVNVAAIPSSLIEAELFGAVRGAFTGADRARMGLAVAADGGTLFLDEIGDLDSDLQVKLLRFMESGEVRAVGSHRARTVDVRIVTATHHDLGRRLREGRFRRDLYFRIAAPEVTIPPLRERMADIPLLKDVFEREACGRYGLQQSAWSAEADAALRRYHWPGNVRELRQVVEVALVRAGGGLVRREHLPFAEPEATTTATWDEAQREFRRSYLLAALRRNGGNRTATARELGISRQAVLYHVRQLGLQDLASDD